MNIDECFQILELKSDATVEELKAARNELLQVWHPDKYAFNPKLVQRAAEKSQKINSAYQTLIIYLRSNQYSQTQTRQRAEF